MGRDLKYEIMVRGLNREIREQVCQPLRDCGKGTKNLGWYHGHCRALMERAQAVPFAHHSSGIMLEGAVFAERY